MNPSKREVAEFTVNEAGSINISSTRELATWSGNVVTVENKKETASLEIKKQVKIDANDPDTSKEPTESFRITVLFGTGEGEEQDCTQQSSRTLEYKENGKYSFTLGNEDKVTIIWFVRMN